MWIGLSLDLSFELIYHITNLAQINAFISRVQLLFWNSNVELVFNGKDKLHQRQ